MAGFPAAPDAPDAPDAAAKPAKVRHTFAQVLERIDDGIAHDEATARLAELVNKMNAQHDAAGGKPKGRITIHVDLKLENGAFDVSADIVVKEPKPTRGRSIMYTEKGGTLTPRNPRQRDLFADVAVTTPPSREGVRVLP